MRFEQIVYEDRVPRPGLLLLGFSMSGKGRRRWTIPEAAKWIGDLRKELVQRCCERDVNIHGRDDEHPWFSWLPGNDLGEDNYDLMRAVACNVAMPLAPKTTRQDPP